MTLSRVVAAFEEFLTPIIAPATVGTALPVVPADLPMITLSIAHISHGLTSIGATPAPSRTGALAVTQDFDLADTTLTFPDGETVDLLSADRLRLHFPHGPVVAVGGEAPGDLASADLTVELDGAPLTVVSGPPGAGEVRGDPAMGEIVFGSPLPAGGALHIEFFIGEWEVDTARYQGDLVVAASASTAIATQDLSVEVIDALHDADHRQIPGLHSLRPTELGPIVVPEDFPASRRRDFTYAFDFEVERVTLETGGGAIRAVEVDSFLDDPLGVPSPPEEFEVVT